MKFKYPLLKKGPSMWSPRIPHQYVDQSQLRQLCLFTNPFKDSDQIINCVINSPNSRRRSKSSSMNSCFNLFFYGWSLNLCRIEMVNHLLLCLLLIITVVAQPRKFTFRKTQREVRPTHSSRSFRLTASQERKPELNCINKMLN